MYPPLPPPPQHSTVVIHTMTGNRNPVGRDPTFIRCPSCQADVVTNIRHVASSKTHAAALCICLVGLWFGCCLIPYITPSCQTANHYCPNCNCYIGSRGN